MRNDDHGGKALHPIGVAADRTGLTPDVLRVWERRYGAVDPTRGPGGQRLYTDEDVERLTLLSRAAAPGRGIGTVVSLSNAELAELVRKDGEARANATEQTNPEADDFDFDRALSSARALDGDGLETQLRTVALRVGVPRFLERSVGPLLQRVGDEWHAGRLSAAQEHLTTAVVQRVVIALLSSLRPEEGAPAILVAGPAGDRHEMGALLASAVAASEGWRVVYLGPDLPASEIIEASRVSKARVVALSIVYVSDPGATTREIHAIREGLQPSTVLLLGGAGVRMLEAELKQPGTRLVGDFDSLREALRKLGKVEAGGRRGGV